MQETHLWAMRKSMEASRKIDPLVILEVQSDFSRRIRDLRLDVPVVVITRAKSAEESDPWIESQQRLAATAPKGKLVRAVGSGHDIQLEQPDLIVAAIRELIDSAGASRTRAR
jgi:pimeloyl-ACP methyl ester carboxylesterase